MNVFDSKYRAGRGVMSLFDADFLVRQYEAAYYDYGEACARLMPLMRELEARGIDREPIKDRVDLERLRARRERELSCGST